jgi:hypothetical protein
MPPLWLEPEEEEELVEFPLREPAGVLHLR